MDMNGICSDNCTYCPRYTATQNGGKIELGKVKELWVRLGFRDQNFNIKEMACHGCIPENNCAYPDLCKCVSGKAHENCGFCDEYPCEFLNKVFDKSEKLKSLAAKVCTQEEMDTLDKAFFSKKEYFDRIHEKHREKV
jgi:hypothetical protein